MKILKTVIATAIVLGSFNLVVANEHVDTKIANIKGATPQERVKLMNEFKVQLAAMNAQDRENAIKQLRSQVRMQKGSKEGMANSKMVNKEMQMQKMSQTDQMNQAQNMNQMNIMNQKQMGSMVGDLPMNPGLMPMSPGSMPMSPGSMPMSPGVLPGGAAAGSAAATSGAAAGAGAATSGAAAGGAAAATRPSSGMTIPTH